MSKTTSEVKALYPQIPYVSLSVWARNNKLRKERNIYVWSDENIQAVKEWHDQFGRTIGREKRRNIIEELNERVNALELSLKWIDKYLTGSNVTDLKKAIRAKK